MENTDNKHNLIIIGNGFDLQCELKTDYSDYFEYRASQINKIDPSILSELTGSENSLGKIAYNYIKQRLTSSLCSHINVWDIIFFSHLKAGAEKKWCDVESTIYSFIMPETNLNIKVSLNFVHSVLKNIIMGVDMQLWNKSIQKINYYIAFYLVDKLDDISYSVDIEMLYKIFLDELKYFEDNFISFIKNQQIGSKYFQQAHQLLEKLNYNGDKYALLNFNYTRPEMNYRKKEKENIITVENVHGDIISGSVIFGVDHSDVNHTLGAYGFTKTSRKIFNSDYSNNTVGVLSKGINDVIVYGHSLNLADRSYFQSIFDFCDLYHSDLNLVFFYSIYKPENALSIKSEKYYQVINLINSYGETLNPHQGKNLLHKLLLENRLHIIEI